MKKRSAYWLSSLVDQVCEVEWPCGLQNLNVATELELKIKTNKEIMIPNKEKVYFLKATELVFSTKFKLISNIQAWEMVP